MLLLEDNQKICDALKPTALQVAVGKADWMGIPFGQNESYFQRAELNRAQSILIDKMNT